MASVPPSRMSSFTLIARYLGKKLPATKKDNAEDQLEELHTELAEIKSKRLKRLIRTLRAQAMEQGPNHVAPRSSIAGKVMGFMFFLAASATALGQPVGDQASGLAVVPPAGYVARAAPSGAGGVAFNVAKRNEDATVCRVEFVAIPGFAQLTQERLNAMAAESDWGEQTRQSLVRVYDVRTVEPFEHAGVRGAAVIGVS